MQFCYERTDRDNTVRFHNLVMQLERAHWRDPWLVARPSSISTWT
jgi:hypothetical protein